MSALASACVSDTPRAIHYQSHPGLPFVPLSQRENESVVVFKMKNQGHPGGKWGDFKDTTIQIVTLSRFGIRARLVVEGE